jgi:hypothetical protein
MIAGHINGGVGSEFADGLLRPVHGLCQRSAGHPNAHVLDFVWRYVRYVTSLVNHRLQVFPAPFFAHARQFAACARGLAQQLRAVAHSAVRLRSSGINSEVQGHGVIFSLSSHNFYFCIAPFFPNNGLAD